MSTDYSPLFRNTSGHTQRFGAEETLTWDFTSATGDPLVLLVGGSTYFTFGRGGTLLIESNITWNADTGGDVGALYDHRPDNVSAASMLAVGAISAGSAGAKLQLNTLTLGHGNVDKYVDAEQGLGSTPFMRYNAVNTRWEFSDDGITAVAFTAGFGTTSWDALYATDKTLIIDSTVLTFNQTATTGVAFQVVRNLAAASTDAPALLAEQQNAGDDQPALAVAQVATAASALDIYEGLLATGTIRYGFGATGKLTITTNSALADSALHIVQNDVDDSFATFEGTEGAGSSVSISTDNGATADMIQVTVDGGTPTTRWIPAYNSTTLPGTISWDGVYLLDKHLDINGAVLQFEQTATTGRGFEVFRNQATSDAPVVVLEQQHASGAESPLALGQLNSAADVLQLYDGSIASGTLRFQFQPQGRLNIVTESTLASEALRIEQNDTNEPFMEFKGTAASGSGSSISTDTSTADMLKVEVDSGSGVVTRWVAAYTSTTSSVPDWDAIYTGDQTLDINGTVLTFDQSSITGVGFTVSRSLAAASTNSPVMKVDQRSTLDDQAALLVSGGIADVAGEVPVLNVLATSAGMASAGDIMVGVQSTAVKHASDTGGSFARAYQADISGAVGSVTALGYYAGTGFDSGIYCKSPVDVILPASGGSVGLTVSVEDLTADGIQVVGIGSNTGNAIYVDANWTYGLYNDSPSYFVGADIVTPTAWGKESLLINQIDADKAFIKYDGTASADELNNVSTVNGVVGDMVRVDVEGATRWMPAYTSATLSAASTWNSIYAAVSGSDLDISTADKPLYLKQDNAALHDGPALRVERLHRTNATNYDDALVLIHSERDIPSTTSAPSLWVRHNMRSATNENFAAVIEMGDYRETGGLLVRHSAGTSDPERYLIKTETTGAVTRFYTRDHGATGIVTSSAVGLPAFSVTQTDTANNGIDISTPSANTGYGLVIDADWANGLYNESPSYFGGAVACASTLSLVDDQALWFGNLPDARILYNTTQTADTLMIAVGEDSRSLLVGPFGGVAIDYAHSWQSRPTIFVHSADTTNIGEYLGLSYLGLSCGVMTTDKAVFDLTFNAVDAFTGATTNNDGGNIVLQSGAADSGGIPGQLQVTLGSDPVLTQDVQDITLTSGGADGASALLSALKINTAGHASDTNDLPIRGIVLDHTAGAGSESSTAILVEEGYNNGIWLDSAPAASGASFIMCDDGTGAILLLADGKISGLGGATVNRFLVTKDGTTSISVDATGDALVVTQNDTGGSARLLSLTDGDASVNRLRITQAGASVAIVNSAATALEVQQAGAGDLFSFKDDTVARMTLSEAGAVAIITKTDLGTEALRIDQNDDDKAFIGYDGAAGSSGAYDSTKNIQAWPGGAGAVVGPTGQSAAEAFYSFQGMTKIEVNASEYWVPYYAYNAS